LGTEASHILAIRPARGIITATAISAAIAAAFIFTPSPDRVIPERDTFVLFPRSVGDWNSFTVPLEPDVARVLGATDHINAIYSLPGDSDNYVNFFAAYYDKQTEGSGIHSPEVCLPVGGWEVYSIDPTPVSFPDTVYGDFELNRAIIEKGLTRQLVYYWFEQRGARMTNDYLAKIDVVYDSLTIGRTDGAMVRFVTPIRPSETEADADARMQALFKVPPIL